MMKILSLSHIKTKKNCLDENFVIPTNILSLPQKFCHCQEILSLRQIIGQRDEHFVIATKITSFRLKYCHVHENPCDILIIDARIQK